MNVTNETPRVTRSIGGKNDAGAEVKFNVSVPQPYVEGPHTLTAGEASALNQTVAENLSNNLRARFIAGVTEGEGEAATTRPLTEAEAQALVDSYLADYEIGVRRTGSGEARVTDPVEREARKIAREKANEYVRSQGGKPGDFDMGPIVEAIFQANKDLLMSEGAKVVKALEKARQNGGIDLSGINLTPKPAAEAAPEAAAA